MNTKNSILLLDPDFDPQTAPQCNLLLKITNNSFSYAIINQEHKRISAVFDEQECENVLQSVKHQLKNDPYLKNDFKAVKIAAYTDHSVAVPGAIYKSTDLKSYANFFPEDAVAPLHVRSNPHFDFTAVFNLQPELEETLQTVFTNAQTFELSSSLLAMAERVENGICMDFTARSFSIVQVSANRLTYKHTFDFDDAAEFNYYLLLLLQQLKIDMKRTPLYLSGIVNEGDDFHQILTKYFPSVSYYLPVNTTLDLAVLEDLPAYYYSNLLAIDLCV